MRSVNVFSLVISACTCSLYVERHPNLPSISSPALSQVFFLWCAKMSIIKCLDTLYCFYGYVSVGFCYYRGREEQISVGDGQMSGEFLLNRCCEIYFLFHLNVHRIKYHNKNMQTIAIFRRYLPLEPILDQTQEPMRMSQPTFFHHSYLTEKRQHRKHISD